MTGGGLFAFISLMRAERNAFCCGCRFACQLLDEVIPILEKRQVILLFESWYAKRELLAYALRYPNLNVICNARHDTAMFELPD